MTEFIEHFHDPYSISIVISCELLTDPEQGSVVITGGEGILPGSEAQYSCEDQHSLVGNEMRVCEENGNWTGVAPFCIASM